MGLDGDGESRYGQPQRAAPSLVSRFRSASSALSGEGNSFKSKIRTRVLYGVLFVFNPRQIRRADSSCGACGGIFLASFFIIASLANCLIGKAAGIRDHGG